MGPFILILSEIPCPYVWARKLKCSWMHYGNKFWRCINAFRCVKNDTNLGECTKCREFSQCIMFHLQICQYLCDFISCKNTFLQLMLNLQFLSCLPKLNELQILPDWYFLYFLVFFLLFGIFYTFWYFLYFLVFFILFGIFYTFCYFLYFKCTSFE